jgi:hypothetical protein
MEIPIKTQRLAEWIKKKIIQLYTVHERLTLGSKAKIDGK